VGSQTIREAEVPAVCVYFFRMHLPYKARDY